MAFQEAELEKLAECIRRDPASWNSIPLLYLHLAKEGSPQALEAIEKLTTNDGDTLMLQGAGNDCILLGSQHSHDKLAEMADTYFWIRDVAMQWRKACRIINMTAAEDRSPPGPEDTPFTPRQGTPSILIVEDDSMTSKMVAHHLQPFGHVITTSNSRQATANYAVSHPDIVFLDIHYQDDLHDGFDVLTNLLSADAKAFVVMVSGDRDPATILKALSLGAKGFIAKPFRTEDFEHYLANFSSR